MAKYNMSGYDMRQMRNLNNSYMRKLEDMKAFGETDNNEYYTIQKGVEVYQDLLEGNISDYEFRNRMKAL